MVSVVPDFLHHHDGVGVVPAVVVWMLLQPILGAGLMFACSELERGRAGDCTFVHRLSAQSNPIGAGSVIAFAGRIGIVLLAMLPLLLLAMALLTVLPACRHWSLAARSAFGYAMLFWLILAAAADAADHGRGCHGTGNIRITRRRGHSKISLSAVMAT